MERFCTRSEQFSEVCSLVFEPVVLASETVQADQSRGFPRPPRFEFTLNSFGLPDRNKEQQTTTVPVLRMAPQA
jgi:hypothetical protein